MWKKISWTVTGVVVAAVALVASQQTWLAEPDRPSGLSRTLSQIALPDGLITPAWAQGNPPPVAEAGPDRTVTAGDVVVLDGSRSTDPKDLVLDFAWQLTAAPAGSAASLSDPTAVKPSFTADLAGTYVAELVVSQQNRESDPDTVTISTDNSAPVADAGLDRSLEVGQTAVLDASRSSDFDGDALAYSWSLVQVPVGSGAALSDPMAVRPEFFVDAAGDYVAELTVDDGTASSVADRVTVSTDNVPPVARAGLDATAADGETLIFDGSKSFDYDGDELDHFWSLISTPPPSSQSLANEQDPRPDLFLDLPGLFLVQLTVTDAEGQVDRDTLAVSNDNSPPVADAGPDATLAVGDTAALDGSDSLDVDGNLLSFRWALLARPAGSLAALSDPAAVRPDFEVDLAGTYVAQLIVFDGTEYSAADTMVISTENSVPVADAGPEQTVALNAAVQLDGTGSSDADGDALTALWTITSEPNGSKAAVSDPTLFDPTTALDKFGDHVYQLEVADGLAEAVPDTVLITTLNARPLAVAGADQDGLRGDVIQLDGSASSDANGDSLTYFWALIARPADSAAALSDPSAADPSFTIDAVGTYVAQLIVNDGTIDSLPATLVIAGENQIPVADAGADQSVFVGDPVQLDGTGSSDPDGDPLSYAWSFASQPAGSTASLDDPAGATPSFTPDAPGDYVIELVVSDGFDPSAPDSVTVSAAPLVVANQPPVLDPVGDQTVALGSTLSLQLTASDPDGDALSFLATPLPLPAGAGLDGAAGLFTFTPDEDDVGVIALTFIVSDGALTDSESVLITVTGAAPGDPTVFTALVLDANAAALGQNVPVEGATVSLLSGGSAVTDANGLFTLTAAAAGDQVVAIDASTANAAPDGSAYAGLQESVLIFAEVINNRDPFYLARVDAAGCAQVFAGSPTTVQNASLGVALAVDADAAFNADASAFTGELCLSDYPAAVPLAALPDFVSPCQLVSIEPAGVTFDPAAAVTLPNLDGLPAGTPVDIWALDPDSGLFAIVGAGAVNPGGADIATTAGGIATAGIVFALPAVPLVTVSADHNATNVTPSALAEGNLFQSYTLPSTRSLEQDRAVRLVYNSAAADPEPIVAAEVTFAGGALPELLEGSLEVGGVTVAGPVFTSTSLAEAPGDPGLQPGETIRQALSFDALGIPTSGPPLQYQASAKFACSKVGAAADAEVLVRNETANANGIGWTIDGLARVIEQPDGSLVLAEGDGSSLRFEPARAFDDFADLDAFTLNGAVVGLNATPVEFGGQTVLRMTNGRSDASTAFITAAIPLEFEGEALSFSSFFSFQITGNGGLSQSDGPGADGITFIIADAPTHLGNTGGFLAYNGVSPSLVVEFDTWNNTWDSNGNHIGINLNGNVASVAQTFVSPRFNNGVVKFAWVDYDAATTTLEVRVSQTPVRPATPNLTRVVDIRALMGAPRAHFGFTSATAQAFADHDLRSWRLELSGENFETVFVSPVSDFSVMVRDPAGGLIRRLKDGTQIVFDADGRQTAEIDRNGNTTSYAYDAQGRLAAITDPAGLATTLVYDVDGRLESVTDAAGRTTTYEHDDQGRLVKVVFPDGSEIAYAHDPEHHITAVTDQRQFSTTYDYGFAGQYLGSGFPDGSSVAASIAKDLGLADLGLGIGTESNPAPFGRPENQMAELTDGNGNVTTIKLDAFGAPVEITDPLGRVTTLERNDDGLPIRITQPSDGQVPASAAASMVAGPGILETELDYDDAGNLTARREAVGTTLERETLFEYEPNSNRVTKVTDPAGNPTDYEYDANGNLLKVTDADTDFETFTYDSRGLQLTAVDKNQNPAATFAYDLNGNLEQVVNPDGSTITFAYDAAGNMTQRTEGVGTPDERNGSAVYDAMNRIESLTDGNGDSVELTYDAAGNIATFEDQSGQVTGYAYDQRGRLAEVSHPIFGTQSFTYDGNDNLRTYLTSRQGLWIFDYDGANRLTRSVDPSGAEQSYAYDAGNNLTALTDARSKTTTFVYDLLSRQIARSNPFGETWETEYDSRDNPVTVTDPQGRPSTHSYDALSRLTGTVLPDQSLTFAYDANGNLLTAANDDSSLAFTYDGLDRVEAATTLPGLLQPGVTLTATYDAVSNRRQLDDDLGGSVVYDYDPAGLLSTLTTAASQDIDFAYDASGRLTGIAWPNTVNSTLSYDLDGRLSAIDHDRGAASLLSLGYTYDTSGQITAIDDNGTSKSYAYDDLFQLTAGGSAAQPETYSYDDEGNRVASHLSASHLIDDANRLVEDDGFCYAYDASGNLSTRTAKVAGACSGDITLYGYDSLDRLTRIDLPGGAVVTYAYDVFGRRIEKNVAGAVTRYVYDGDDILLEFDGANALQARYAHGAAIDQPLAMARGGAEYYYQRDHLGSIRLLTDAAGNIANSYQHDSFGRRLAASEAVANPFAFTGREFDPESGLYHYRFRAYDPESGRFLQQDPLGFGGGDTNLYAYVFNDPLHLRDPYGLTVLAEFATDACVGGIMGTTTGSFFGAIANTLYNAVDLAINEGAVLDSAQTIVRAAVDAGTDAAQTAAATEAALCGTPIVAVGVVRSVRALPRLLRKLRPGGRAITAGPREIAETAIQGPKGGSDFVDLVSPQKRTHILDGDATGGGHRAGTGNPGKSEFPAGWSDDKIIHEISDVATDPSAVRHPEMVREL